jgi:hypothetical protein
MGLGPVFHCSVMIATQRKNSNKKNWLKPSRSRLFLWFIILVYHIKKQYWLLVPYPSAGLRSKKGGHNVIKYLIAFAGAPSCVDRDIFFV